MSCYLLLDLFETKYGDEVALEELYDESEGIKVTRIVTYPLVDGL